MVEQGGHVHDDQIGFCLPLVRQRLVHVLVEECFGLCDIDSARLEQRGDGFAEVLMIVVHVARNGLTGLLLLLFGE
jgi:hypothetical protein